jgi:deoxyribodipyrimidine photo-lyase
MNLVWFRNDLRLADNPALFHALNSGNHTTALFMLHPKQHLTHGESPQKFEFIKAHVNDLSKRLRKMGVPSIVRMAPHYRDATAVMKQVIEQHQAEQVFFNHSYWLNEQQRDLQVIKQLQQNDIKINQYHSNYLLPPGTVRKSDGSMYHVFTPYKNKFIESLKAHYQMPLAIPRSSNKSSSMDSITETPNIEHAMDEDLLKLWPIGEVAAAARLKAFAKENDYCNERDFPAIAGTSSVSPYLVIGVLSARQCLAYMLKAHGETAFNSTWVSELIWRDFYNDLMFEYPKLAKHQTFKPQAVDHWHNNPELFKLWQQGQTGFPIVDAGMRQLLQEGWMHNRVRMIVASFLTKLCLIDWRLGEAHFMAHLLDGDLASNNGGWQWSSATGCDAAPYFRIFNPTTQSKNFDPDGTYIRKYVPELQAVNAKDIHEPKVNDRALNNYPQPCIDYKKARADALMWFKVH